MANATDRALSGRLQGMAEGLDEVLEKFYGSRVGFVLILAPFDQPQTEVQYVSNCKREDGADLIRKLFERWQLFLPDVPTHEKQ